MKVRHFTEKVDRWLMLLPGVAALLLSGCRQPTTKERVSLHDRRMLPLIQATAKVDRAAMGFTPDPFKGEVYLETSAEPNASVLLDIANSPTLNRQMIFEKQGTEYRWIHEIETHTGPKSYPDVDGILYRETLSIAYQYKRRDGITQGGFPTDKTDITYTGGDPRLVGPGGDGRSPESMVKLLSLEQVRPILHEWGTIP